MQTITEILIDYSTSMQGESLAICKKILLEEVIPLIDYSSKIGVKTFSASQAKEPIIEKIQSLKVTNKEELTNAVLGLDSPNGNTPIAEAIKSSVKSLKEYPAYKKKIILVTDGEENCNGDYEAEAKKASKEGVECEIHVIGLGLKDVAIEKARRISNATGGTFSNINTPKLSSYKTEVTKKEIKDLTIAISPKHSDKTFDNRPQRDGIGNLSSKSEASITDGIQSKTTTSNSKDIDLVSSVKKNSELLENITRELEKIKSELKNSGSLGLRFEDGEVIIKEDSELNEKIRIESEKYVYEILKDKYRDRVKWLNENGESGQDHDFEVIDLDDTIEYFIECKGSVSPEKSFLLTKNEWRLFLNQTKNYQVFFVSNALSNPTLVKIDNLLDWLLKGKIVPFATVNRKLKAERVVLTIID